MFRVLVSDKLGQPGLDRLSQDSEVSLDVNTGLSKAELVDIIGNYEALIVRSATKVDADVLAAGRNLKVVGRAGIGVDNVDVKAATARGVIVMNTPQANAIATAEFAMSLLLGASRHVAHAHMSVAGCEWDRARFTGQQLYGKVLGLIGCGQIGRLVAKRAKAFEMEVIACDPYVSEDVARAIDVRLVDLDDLLAKADYISLHTSLSAETESLINSDTLKRMRDGVVLINAARGKLIDEAALADALHNGKVKAAAIDVYRQEPPGPEHPLVGLPNVLHTPHLGASTEEAQRDVAIQIADQVLDALRGKDFRNSINMPYVSGPEFKKVLPYMQLAEKIGVLQFHMAPRQIRRVEIAVRQEDDSDLLRPVAAALLKGLLENFLEDSVNYVNAPVLAEEHGIRVTQGSDMGESDFAHAITCRVHWDDGSRIVTGALFSGAHPRIVQISKYHMDVDPSGIVLLMLNKDLPGVVGDVGSVLGRHGVNIGEWRLGRAEKGGEALSFVNLDDHPPAAAIDELQQVGAVTKVKVVDF